MRRSEVVLLKVSDIDSQRMNIRVVLGKGSKDPGGLSKDHRSWVRPRYPFFLPVKGAQPRLSRQIPCRPQRPEGIATPAGKRVVLRYLRT
jgi:hypothetical protein